MLRVTCSCGEVFHADEKHVGRRLRCRCGRTVTVQASRPDPAPAARGSRGPAGPARARGGPASRPASTARPSARVQRLTRWLGWACWSYVAVAMAAVLLLWGAGDRWWPGTAILFGPRWLLLVPLPLLAIAAGALRRGLSARRSVAPLLLAAVLVAGPLMGLRLGWQGLFVGSGGGDVLRVATFNAVGDTRPVLALVDLLIEWRIDVAAVQECNSDVPRVLEPDPAWHVHRSYGLCLLSRFPIEAAEPMRWEELDAVSAAGAGQSGTVVRYRLRGPGREFLFANLHLETPRKGLERLRYRLEVDRVATNTMIRAAGSRRAAASLAPRRSELVVLGDFNMPVESAIYRDSWSAFANAFSRAGRGFGFTKDNGWIRVRIDHVLLGGEWRPRRAWVGPDLGSDHWPLFAEIISRRSD